MGENGGALCRAYLTCESLFASQIKGLRIAANPYSFKVGDVTTAISWIDCSFERNFGWRFPNT